MTWILIRKILPYVLALVAVLGVLFGVHRDGTLRERQRWEAKTAIEAARAAEGYAKVVSAIRAQENAATARSEALALELKKERSTNAKAVDDLRARVRSGDLRLQYRPDASGNPGGEAPGDPSGATGASPGGVPAAAAEDLLVLVRDADDLALRYNKLLEFTRAQTCEVHDAP